MLSLIENSLFNQLTSDEHSWLTTAISNIKNATDYENELLNASVVVKRKFTILYTIQLPSSNLNNAFKNIATFETSELVRLLLINTALQNIQKTQTDVQKASVVLLKQYYRLGDESEKCALLKSLSLLDFSGNCVNIAVNATRCNSLIEFTSLALHNNYPAEHFEQLNFNQLVLKSLFMGLNISLINGLASRLNESLSNMCIDYVIEQALADRVPPASLWLGVRYKDLSVENIENFKQYITHFYHTDAQHKKTITKLIQSDILPSIKFD